MSDDNALTNESSMTNTTSEGLTSDCAQCNGSGYVDVYDAKGVLDIRARCNRCGGLGKEPTKEEDDGPLVLCQFNSPVAGYACNESITRCVQCPYIPEIGD